MIAREINPDLYYWLRYRDNTHTRARARTHARSYTRARTHAHAHAHTHTRTCTRAHVHKHFTCYNNVCWNQCGSAMAMGWQKPLHTSLSKLLEWVHRNLLDCCCFMHCVNVTRFRFSQAVGKNKCMASVARHGKMNRCTDQWTNNWRNRKCSGLEREVCLMNKITTDSEEVNQCRRELFTKKGRQMEALPPTRAALFRHIKRDAYHAVTNLPCPIE